MAWDASLELGIELVDNQHRELVSVVEELIIASSEKDLSSTFINTLMFLEDYTLKHFADEEAYQVASDYPDYLYHKRLHEDLVQDLVCMKNDIDAQALNRRIISGVPFSAGLDTVPYQ